MDSTEWSNQFNNVENGAKGLKQKAVTGLSQRDARQAKSKLDHYNKTITSLSQTCESWLRQPSKFGMSEGQVRQRQQLLASLKSIVIEVENVVDAGKGEIRNKMFEGYDPLSYKAAEESDETMYASNRDLLQMHEQELENQDMALGNISRGLGNLKAMSQQANKELTLQSHLLDDIEKGVDRTDAHLKSNIKRVTLVDEESDGGCCTCLIMFALFVAIIFLATTDYVCYLLPNTSHPCGK